MANIQILVTKMLDECCFPGSSDSHHGNNRIIGTIRHQLHVFKWSCPRRFYLLRRLAVLRMHDRLIADCALERHVVDLWILAEIGIFVQKATTFQTLSQFGTQLILGSRTFGLLASQGILHKSVPNPAQINTFAHGNWPRCERLLSGVARMRANRGVKSSSG